MGGGVRYPRTEDPEAVTLPDGTRIHLLRRWLTDDAVVLSNLLQVLPLHPERVTVFGREHWTPRLVSWHGDPECRYRYSGRTFTPTPWTPDLAALRDRVCAASGYAFNSVLVNVYRDGRDAMGAHRDDEPELGPERHDIGVASLSLGARRRFVLEHEPSKRRFEWALGEGDLLLMGGETQRWCKHWVPRTRTAVELRMNLTFRVVCPFRGIDTRARDV